MAVKTITIDLDAYALLARRKRPGQSFSQVIKRHFGGGRTAADFRAIVRTLRVSGDTLATVEAQIKSRRSSPARAVRA